jgi:ubiquinone/menaquinone biosynthesis C-methylase UbiE
MLDVGCGPGALTRELVRRLGPAAVWAVDPSEQFVEAVRGRHAGVRVQRGAAETLSFEDRRFEVTLAQLVVDFMADPVQARLRELCKERLPGAPFVVSARAWAARALV